MKSLPGSKPGARTTSSPRPNAAGEIRARAAAAIIKAVQILGQHPHIGRPIVDLPEEFREWPIDFGDSGYVARYRYDGDEDVMILAIRHQKEAGE